MNKITIVYNLIDDGENTVLDAELIMQDNARVQDIFWILKQSVKQFEEQFNKHLLEKKVPQEKSLDYINNITIKELNS